MADFTHNAMSGRKSAPKITGQFLDDTCTLVDRLTALDFSRSKLPREILEDWRPGTTFCKLAFSTKVELVKKLTHCRQAPPVSIRSLDEKLLNLIIGLDSYVRAGDVVSTLMTHEALVRGIVDIRCNFPQNPAISPEQFVQINTEYLGQWFNLIQWAEIYDRQSKNLAQQRLENQLELDRVNRSIDDIGNRIETDPDFGDTFFHIRNHDTPTDRANWTQAQREVHLMLVEHRLSQFTLELSNTNLASLEQDQLSVKHKIDTLRMQLAAVPIVTDPDLLNKYRESMNNFIHDMAASDAFTEETLRQATEFQGVLDHLEQTSGAMRQNTAAAEGARATMEQLSRLNQARGTRLPDPT